MTTANQPGWYDDPENANAQRYWDGQGWTPHCQRKPAAAARQPVPPPASPPAPAAPMGAGSAPMPPPPPPPNFPPPSKYPAAAAPQGSDVPPSPPPPAWPPPGPQIQSAGAQTASEGLAAAKGFAARLSVTAWLLFGGFAIAAIAVFFKWVTVNGPGAQIDVSPFRDFWTFLVLLVIAGAAWLAWPTATGSQMPVNRLIGLTAAVGLIVVGVVVGVVTYVNWVSKRNDAGAGGEDVSFVHVSIGSGWVLYTAATVAIVVGLVRLWRQRSRTQNQAY